ncbi:MAG: NAD(P)(+) transhydrogenase (Re/Si-specific) subunit alpha, partial [Planctomycetes bacterium]|nr:NAD(P)(+) transhydrogenase (Re/Si-specific) subunit alpha [Planctomycetota bacterium]
RAMKYGSVLVDLAAEQGGNCELTAPGETKVVEGVTICGPLDLPSGASVHASEMYSNNISMYLKQLLKDGRIELDLEDELIRAPLVTREGEVLHEAARAALDGEAKS